MTKSQQFLLVKATIQGLDEAFAFWDELDRKAFYTHRAYCGNKVIVCIDHWVCKGNFIFLYSNKIKGIKILVFHSNCKKY